MHPNARNNRNFEKVIKQRRNRVKRVQDYKEKDKFMRRQAFNVKK